MRKLYKMLLACAVAGTLTACSTQTGAPQGAADTTKAAGETGSAEAEKAPEGDGSITLYLVRHGKTFLNTTDQVQGWIDSPLTEKGESQADAVGRGMKDIKFVSAFSSDLGRQRETALRILAQNAGPAPELREVIGLREWFYGGYEGKMNAEMWAPIFEAHGLKFDAEWSQYGELLKQMTDEDIANAIAANDALKQAETYDQITKRTREAMDEIVKVTQEAGGGNALVVSSGSEIPTILELVVPGQYQGEDISNCSVSILTYKDGVYTLETCGDTSYLEAGKTEEEKKQEAEAAVAAAAEPEDTGKEALATGEILIPSARGTEIHATFTVPENIGENGCPLVLFAHGFMGSRDESGEFTAVADGLAERGIASMRIDFPGCNESTESFLEYNFKNMSDDMDAALAYAREAVKVDESRLGILGYSMGGRLASLYLDKEAFHTAVLWAPAASNGFDAASAMGTAAQMEEQLKKSQTDGKGVIHIWDEDIEVGAEYLQELKEGKPLEQLAAYTGNLLVVTGGIDDTVVKSITDQVLETAVNTSITANLNIPRAGHGLGGYEGDQEVVKVVVDATVNFFDDNLN